MKANSKNLPDELKLKPRVTINFNTGTRVILSKKDKAKTRRALKSRLAKNLNQDDDV